MLSFAAPRAIWIAAGLGVCSSITVQQPSGGIVGSFRDPGSGVLVSGARGATRAQAIFQVGVPGRAPYARELVTLAPTATRNGNTLTIASHYERKRTDVKIPGGLGAFWEIDLQDQEGSLLRDTLLEAAGVPIVPGSPGGTEAVFAIPASTRAPYHVAYRLEFFKRSEVFRFTIGADGKASFDGPAGGTGASAGRGGPGLIKDPALTPDPKLPKRDRPDDPFTETASTTGGGKPAARANATKIPAPKGWDARRGTWLTPTAIKDRPQDLGGVWTDADAKDAPELLYFDATPQRLRAGSLANRGRAFGVDVTPAGAGTWKGTVYVCPVPDGTCPNLCRWVRGGVSVDGDGLHATGHWYDKKSKPDCTGYTDTPDDGPLAYRRFVGVSFLPLLPGKYMHLIAAPAVGPQQAQFKAAVRLVTMYAGIPGATVRVRSAGGTIAVLDKTAGTYQFVADRSGVYEITFELVDSTGAVFHTDRVRVEIPSIPGLGF